MDAIRRPDFGCLWMTSAPFDPNLLDPESERDPVIEAGLAFAFPDCIQQLLVLRLQVGDITSRPIP